jgi:hypothetical protein
VLENIKLPKNNKLTDEDYDYLYLIADDLSSRGIAPTWENICAVIRTRLESLNFSPDVKRWLRSILEKLEK